MMNVQIKSPNPAVGQERYYQKGEGQVAQKNLCGSWHQAERVLNEKRAINRRV
jgi:hypothetical protein